MNTNDFRDLNYDWDAERAYRLRRRRARKLAELYNAVVYAALAIGAFALVFVLCRHVARRPVEERAAYLEGRFGLDHATAIVYASEELKVKGEELRNFSSSKRDSAQVASNRNFSLFTFTSSL